jgi:hypothetical protein
MSFGRNESLFVAVTPGDFQFLYTSPVHFSSNLFYNPGRDLIWVENRSLCKVSSRAGRNIGLTSSRPGSAGWRMPTAPHLKAE